MSNLLIITGASRGIGFATAQLFLQQGWQVINISRKPCALPGVVNLAIDLSIAGSLQQQEQTILSAINNADKICLTHNAGLLFKDSVPALPEQNLRAALEVNLIAPALLNQIILPQMKTGSSILYIGSTLSELAVPNSASYTTTKHALVGLMRATCQDLFGRGISTACICPGFTNTEMVREHIGNDPAVMQGLAAQLTSGRLAQPEEIADLIYFCALHPVMNGAILHANQGGPQTTRV